MERFLRGGFRQGTNLESISETEDVGDVNGDQSSVSHSSAPEQSCFLNI